MWGDTKSVMSGVLRKCASVMLAAFLILSLNFAAHMISPGDPSGIIYGPYGPTPQYWKFIEDARLNDSLLVQYVDYIADTLTGDLRERLVSDVEIADFIWHSTWNTFVLLTIGVLGSLMIGALLERIARSGKAKLRALAVHGTALAGLCIPATLVALFMAKVNVAWDLELPMFHDGNTHLDGESLAYSIIKRAILPVTAILLSSIPLAVMVFREGLAKSETSGPVKGPRLTNFASGLARMRPVAHLHVAWTMAVVLVVDMTFLYGGLGERMLESLYTRDIALLMATTLFVPMIVLLFGTTVSLSLHLLARIGAQEALRDWGRGDVVRPVPLPTRSAEGLGPWVVSLWNSFKSSRMGIVSAILLAALLAVGALAPVLATVSDPAEIPIQVSWENRESFPLPPSLERSPITGLVHLLGTDMFGRDVYSLMLYATRYTATVMVALILSTVALGYVMGAVAARTASVRGLPARVLDFLLTAFARAFVAIPLLVVLAMRWYSFDNWDLGILFTLVLAFYVLAWPLIVRPVRAAGSASKTKMQVGAMAPTLLSESLSVAKFAVPLIILTAFANAIITGSGDTYDWGEITADWVNQLVVVIDGGWHLIVVPALGVLAVCGTAFAFLDRAERAVRDVRSYPNMSRRGSQEETDKRSDTPVMTEQA